MTRILLPLLFCGLLCACNDDKPSQKTSADPSPLVVTTTYDANGNTGLQVHDSHGKVTTISVNPAAADLMNISSFKISRAGNRIAHLQRQRLQEQFYVSASNGENQHLLLSADVASVTAYAWSPDGKYLAYQYANWPEIGSNLMVWNSATEEASKLNIDILYAGDFYWSVDNKLLFNAGNGNSTDGYYGLYIFDSATNTTFQFAAPTADEKMYTDTHRWSPDGSHVSYLKEVNDVNQIFIANIESRESVPVIDHRVNEEWIQWSPLGDTLVYFDQVADTALAASQLFQTTPAGTTPAQVSAVSSSQYIYTFSWSPNAEHLAYYVSDWAAAEENERFDIYIHDDSLALKKIINGVHLIGDSADYSGFFWSPDGRYLVYSTPNPQDDTIANIEIYDVLLDQHILTVPATIDALFIRDEPFVWHSTSTAVVFSTSDNKICMVTVSSSALRCHTINEEYKVGAYHWASSGEYLVFTRHLVASLSGGMNADVYSVDAKLKNPLLLGENIYYLPEFFAVW